MPKIRVGTRASKLALVQTNKFVSIFSARFPEVELEIIPISTSGDLMKDRSLVDIGGKGLFIKELEEALIKNQIDVAVHSAKDLPPLLHSETQLSAFLSREDAGDCFVSRDFFSILSLPIGATIGTSSPRRKAILLNIRKDFKIVNFRGNLDTRLQKIEDGVVDAAVLALSGINRLGLNSKVKQIFTKDEFVPAGGQGAIAIQTKNSNSEIVQLLRGINDSATETEVTFERAFLRELGASCTTPVGVNAEMMNGVLRFRSKLYDFETNQPLSYLDSQELVSNLREAEDFGIKSCLKFKNLANSAIAYTKSKIY